MKQSIQYLKGHELELRYVNYITILKSAQNNPSWSDFLWMWILKARLQKRLERLEESLKTNCINSMAYNIWKLMIEEVL